MYRSGGVVPTLATSEKRLISTLLENYKQNGVEGRPVLDTSKVQDLPRTTSKTAWRADRFWTSQEFKTSQELPAERRRGQTGSRHLKSLRPPKNYQQNGLEGRPVLEASRV